MTRTGNIGQTRSVGRRSDKPFENLEQLGDAYTTAKSGDFIPVEIVSG